MPPLNESNQEPVSERGHFSAVNRINIPIGGTVLSFLAMKPSMLETTCSVTVIYLHLSAGPRIARRVRIGDAHFREAVAQGVARKAQGARGLALVAVGAAQGFANDFVFPLLERHAVGKDAARNRRTRRGRRAVEMNIGGVERGAGGERDGALENIFEVRARCRASENPSAASAPAA